jgi:WD40 repeat protein/predicted RecA/RadA family phage recombinase
MPATSYSYRTYAGAAAGTTFAVSFPFLAREHVAVFTNLDMAAGTWDALLLQGVDYSWVTDAQIQMLVGTTGKQVTILRETPISALIAPFSDGSNVDMGDFNTASLQDLYAVQEIRDKTVFALSFQTGGDYAALAARISALETAIVNAQASGTSAQLQVVLANDPATANGTIVWLNQAIASPPSGYLYANGIDKQRSQYNVLFNVIGTTYGPGDGTTTFGFPLEANLSNPFNNSAYHPFIKYGTRTSGPGQIFAKVVDTTTMAGWIVDGLNVTSTLSFTGGTGLISDSTATSGPSFSADGTLLTAGSINTSGQNVFVWKKSGNSFSLITISPALVSAVPVTAAALSPDGNYLVVASKDSTTTFWIYKANSTKTAYSLLTTKSFASAFNTYGPAYITWSDSGNYLAFNNNAGPFAQPPGGSQIRLFARSGDTFTEMTGPTASYANDNVTSSAFSPDDNFYAFVTFNGNLNIYSRTGSSYSLLTTQSIGWGVTLKWPDNTKILVGQPNGSKLLTFNGAVITAVASNGMFMSRYALSKFAPNQFYHLDNGNLYSWDASYNVSLVGSTTGQVVTGYCATAALAN